ncbi:MAG: hypothetical protein ACERKN_04620 [Velocimicrobium sp.]
MIKQSKRLEQNMRKTESSMLFCILLVTMCKLLLEDRGSNE